MKYKVIRAFADLQDCNHLYNQGDEYPRKGYSPSAERIDELQTAKNRAHEPLIQLVEMEKVVEEPKTVVQPVVEAVVEEPKKRGRKKKNDD